MNLHVLPMGDQIIHETNEDCVCGPDVVPVKREDGSIGYVITHHSLDGRESSESPAIEDQG